MEELRKQVEKESNIMCEEATKYLNSKKSEVESKRRAMETRQRNVESVLGEVPFLKFHNKSVQFIGRGKIYFSDLYVLKGINLQFSVGIPLVHQKTKNWWKNKLLFLVCNW